MKNSTAEGRRTDGSEHISHVTIRAPAATGQNFNKGAGHGGIISGTGRKYTEREANLLFGVTTVRRSPGVDSRSIDNESKCQRARQDSLYDVVMKISDLRNKTPSRRNSWAEAPEFITPRPYLNGKITPTYGSPGLKNFPNAMPMTDFSAEQFLAFQMCQVMQYQCCLMNRRIFDRAMRMMMPACTGSPPMMSRAESAALFGPPLPPQQHRQGTTQWSPSVQVVNYRRARSFGPVTQASPRIIHKASEDSQRAPKGSFGSPVKEVN